MSIHSKKTKYMSRASAFFALSGMLALFFVSYVYMVNQTVRNVVQRERAGGEISELRSKLSDLELRYIDRKNEITVEFAEAKGFREQVALKFVDRNGSRFSLKGE